MSRFYRLHDSDPELKQMGAIPTPVSELETWNVRGWGVFHVVNEFDGRRRISNLRRIRSWITEIDGDKDAARERLERSPLVPSRVIESKNGFHAYWDAKPDANPKHYKTITTALAERFGGDMNARDLARILRTPGFKHQKDPHDPFLVQQVHRWEVTYTERQMAWAFGVEFEDEQPEPKPKPRPLRFPTSDDGDDFWTRAVGIDARIGLERLSGHWLVGGETIELKPAPRGRHNIRCDGKGTSCFVDADGKIGSADGGGPSIVRWCAWYGHSWGDIARGLKEVFPELDDKGAA